MSYARVTADGADITAAVCALNLTSSLDTLGASLSFEIPWSDITRYNMGPLSLGSTVRLYDSTGCVFIGTVTAVQNGEYKRSYTCHDKGWYLGKSKVTIQFTGITVTEAISALFSEIGAHTGSIPAIDATVEEACYCETPAAILDKLLERAEEVTGTKYYVGVNYAPAGQYGVYFGVYRIGQLTTNADDAEYTGAEREETLENVVNHAVYVSGDSTGYTVETEAEDAGSREKYGTVSEIVIRESEDTDAAAIVHNIVYAKAQPIPTASVECRGDWSVKAGHRFAFADPVTGCSGDWYVQSVTNTADKGEHRMQLYLVQLTQSRRYTDEVKASVGRNKEIVYYNNSGLDPRKDVIQRE